MKKNPKDVMKKVVSTAMAAIMSLSLCPTISFAAENTYTVAWIGGSFTEGTSGGGTRFSTLVTDWMNENSYAGSGVKVKELNKGIGGTTSGFGALRYDDDVLANNPDMVIIEFAGNDSGTDDTFSYANCLIGMETMIRKTIAKNPETKIAVLFRPDWGNAVGAKAIHRLVADYYDVPIITADEVETKSEWVLADNTHPNTEGNKKIAEYINQWLANNKINKPTYKQFPLNANYRTIMPVKKSIDELIDTEKSPNATKNEAGYYTIKNGESLCLKVKGSVFAVCGAGENSSVGTYAVDPKTVETNKQGSRVRGYINAATKNRPQTVNLDIGEGEHSVQILANGNNANDLLIKDIYVDAVAYGEAEDYETVQYNVFEDDIKTMTGSNIHKTVGGAAVVYSDYNYMTGQGDVYGLQSWNNTSITYDNLPQNKAISTVTMRSVYSDISKNSYELYAIDSEGNKTKLETTKIIRDAGEGSVSYNSWKVVDIFTTSPIPANTAKLQYSQIINGQSVNILNVKYFYGDKIMEKLKLEAPEQLLVGDKENAVLKGVYSNNEELPLESVDDVIYTSSDSNVAAVNLTTGAITATGAGRATILATATVNGKDYEATAVVNVFSNENIQDAYFTVPKTNYIVGTEGKLDLVTVIDGATEKNKFTANYVSNDEKVVKVEADGSFTALKAGTATINASVPALAKIFEPITITVHETNIVNSYLKSDVDNGLVDEKMFDMTSSNVNRGAKLQSFRHGTKLYAMGRNSQHPQFDGNYIYHYTGDSANNAQMGFIFEIDNGLQQLDADVFTYNAGNVAKRIQIGYLTEDAAKSLEVHDAVYGKKIPFESPDLTGYGAPGAMWTGNDTNGYAMRSEWTSDSELEMTANGNNKRNFKSIHIPQNAKYALVFVNNGKTTDGDSAIAGWTHRFAGVKLTYAPKIASGEITKDGKIAITYTKDMGAPELTIVKNNETVTPEVIYDAETFTSYIDIAAANGDNIKITATGVEGEYSTTVQDNREQIKSIVVKDVDGYQIDEIYMDDEKVNVNVEIINTTETKVNIIAAYYEGNKLVSVAMPQETSVTPVDGAVNVSFDLTLGEGAKENGSVKVFAWKANLAPIADYSNNQAFFEMGDF